MMEDNFFMGVFKKLDLWLPKTQKLRKWPHGPISLLSASCIKEFFVGISLQHLQIQLPSYHLHFDHCDDDIRSRLWKWQWSLQQPKSYVISWGFGITFLSRPFQETWHFHSDFSSQHFRKTIRSTHRPWIWYFRAPLSKLILAIWSQFVILSPMKTSNLSFPAAQLSMAEIYLLSNLSKFGQWFHLQNCQWQLIAGRVIYKKVVIIWAINMIIIKWCKSIKKGLNQSNRE